MQLKRAFCKLKTNKQINHHIEFLILLYFMVIWKSGYQTIEFFFKSYELLADSGLILSSLYPKNSA